MCYLGDIIYGYLVDFFLFYTSMVIENNNKLFKIYILIYKNYNKYIIQLFFLFSFFFFFYFF
jgi:hypothetical protein